MKKLILFAVSFLLCVSFLYAELTKAQLWAISLTGILTEANSSYRNSLNAFAMNDSGRSTALRLLNRDWGIFTREELFEALDSLEEGGHAAAFREIQEIINEINESIEAGYNEEVIYAILNKQEWDNIKWIRFRYVHNNWDKYQNRTIKAWDLGRSISLCRWGYSVGFLTEEEAWKRIFHIAGLIQPLYSSWEEYGYDYYMGRLFWASSSGEEESYLQRTEPIYRKLLNSYWSWLDWNVDLEAEEADVPIIERGFFPPDDKDGTLRYLTNDPSKYNKFYWYSVLNSNPDTVPVVYELETKKISGNDDYGYGMLFCLNERRNSDASYYRFFINVNGRYTVQKNVGGVWAASPVSWRDSPFLEKGFGVYNTLRIERTDNFNGVYFRVIINGNFVASFFDDDPINGIYFAPAISINIMEREQFPHIPVDIRFRY